MDGCAAGCSSSYLIRKILVVWSLIAPGKRHREVPAEGIWPGTLRISIFTKSAVTSYRTCCMPIQSLFSKKLLEHSLLSALAYAVTQKLIICYSSYNSEATPLYHTILCLTTNYSLQVTRNSLYHKQHRLKSNISTSIIGYHSATGNSPDEYFQFSTTFSRLSSPSHKSLYEYFDNYSGV